MNNHNPIILPLDGMSKEKALETAEKFAGRIWGVKVNDLLDQGGAQPLIHELSDFGKVFADPKLHDIPNTVANRVKRYIGSVAGSRGADFITVHASGGIEMMRAAVANRGDSKILAVTVLTSLSEDEAHLICGKPVKAAVIQMARNALIAGVQGIVCSPLELAILGKSPEFNGLIKVTPGVRPEWAAAGDQERVMTPGEAIKAGADYLVIGRPITNPPPEIGSPENAIEKIMAEIEEVRRVSGGDITNV